MSFFLTCCAATQPVPASLPQSTESSSTEVLSSMSLPTPAPAKLFQHVLPQQFQLSSGIPVLYVHDTRLPMVTLKLVFPTGTSSDPAGKEGLTSLMSALLKEGANGLSAAEFSDAIEDLGASINVHATADYTTVSLQILTQFFEKGLDLTLDIVRKPNLQDEDLQRYKKIWLNNLNLRASSPEQVAKLASLADFFGEAHPYAKPSEGYVASVEKLTQADVRQRYEEVMTLDKMYISAVGNISPEEFANILNIKFGSPASQSNIAPKQCLKSASRTQTFTIVDKPGASQSIIRIMLPAPCVTNPLQRDIKFVNVPFGDSFTSRLMQNIREDKGYSYGANSAISALPQAGYLLAASAVATEVTGAALSEFMKEFARLEQGDFTLEELERAKETWQSELIQNFESQSSVASIFVNLFVSGESLDTHNAFLKRTREMTLETFNEIARKIAPFSQASITIVGDKAEILKQTEHLGLATPTFRDKEGFLVTP